MLDNIRDVAKGWVGKVLLALIGVPFILFGIDSYLNSAGKNVAVAEIGNKNISIQEYSEALKNLRNRLQLEGKIDQSQLNGPEIKAVVLNQLISKQLLAEEIQHANYAISDTQLATYITGIPEFQKDGKFSQEAYDQILQKNNLTPSRFEAGMRADLLAQQAQDGIARLGFISNTRVNKIAQLANQQRVVSIAEIKNKDFMQQVKVKPSEIQDYYNLHKNKLVVPEQVKIEFLLLSPAGLIGGVKVDDNEIKKFYEDNTSKFQGNEQRRASHILIGFGVNATPQQKQQAKEKAEELLVRIKKDPSQFEALAVKNSQDTGSAVKGGDLGSFGRGAMVKPFEDTAFSMKVNQVSNVVESEFGYHIIKVTEITGQSSDFNSLKPQIKAELIFQKAQVAFTEQAENFSNMVYEQSGSLEPAAKAFKGQVQKSDWLSRAEGAKFFKNDKIMDLIFSDEVLKGKRNSEAVEVSPNNLVSARLLEYKPAAPRSFEEVKGGIEEFLKLEAASKLALDKGKQVLKSLQQGQAVIGIEWIPEVTVDRKNAQGLTEIAMNQVFHTNTSKLPAYSGVENAKQGYLLVKVLKVITPAITDVDSTKTATMEIETALKSEYLAAYKQSLRDKSKVKVNNKLLLENAADR